MSGAINEPLLIDEDLVRRLPLPLAQLYRRAFNAKNALERHHAASSLWELSLKLLASVAIVEYADRTENDEELAEKLKNLARPSLGHWWEYTRRLVPLLADAGDPHFQGVRELLLGRRREDMPRASGLDAALIELAEDRQTGRATVSLTELFDRLVNYRNKEIGHGALASRGDVFIERMNRALLLGISEVLHRVDVLAGRRLIYVEDVRRQASGSWLIVRYELTGESGRKLESCELPHSEVDRLPITSRVYIESLAEGERSNKLGRLCALHPLVSCDEQSWRVGTCKVFFLNGRRGKRKAEYLCYATGEHMEQDDFDSAHLELLSRVLHQQVQPQAMQEWVEQSEQAEAPSAPEPQQQNVMRTLGEFELLSRIGSGKQGHVYRAWQPAIGRQVALKCLLRPGDPACERRFQREIRVLGKVEHPNLVRTYTSGTVADQWYLAMELVEGATLDSVTKHLADSIASEVSGDAWRSALSTACSDARTQEESLTDSDSVFGHGRGDATEAILPAAVGSEAQVVPIRHKTDEGHIAHVVEVMRQISVATHALHDAGVIHRDIKPGNIMLTPDGKMAVLMDLGLAQLADETEGTVTRTRQFVGTMRYASPEQVYEAHSVDRRSDVYSLGATLWELITLRPLFSATDRMPMPELSRKILVEDVERPRKYNPRVPRDLEAIVLKCLCKEPERRYSTAQALAEDLNRWQSNEPVLAQPPSVRYVAGKYLRRHWLGLSTVAAALLAITLGIGVVGVSSIAMKFKSAKEQVEKAQAETQIALKESRDNAKALEETVQQLEVAREQESLQKQRAEEALEIAENYAQVASQRAIQLDLASARQMVDAGDWSGALVWMADALGLAEEEDQPLHRRRLSLALKQVPMLTDAWYHEAPVTSAVFSPSGQQVLAIGGPTASLWKVGSPEPVAVVKHDRPITSAAFSPDGKLFITTSLDRTARLYSATDAALLHTMPHEAAVRHAAFHPGGTRLITVGDERRAYLWDVTTGGRTGRAMEGHSQPIVHATFSPDGRIVVTTSIDGTSRVWNADNGAAINLTGQAEPADEAPQQPAAPGRDQPAKTIAAEAPGMLNQLVHDWPVGSARFANDGQTLITLPFGPTAPVAAQGGQQQPQPFALGPESAEAKVEQSQQAAEQLPQVTLWRRSRTLAGTPLQVHSSYVYRLAYSPDGSMLATAGWDKTAGLWNTTANKAVDRLAHSANVEFVQFSPDGKLLVTAGRDGVLQIFHFVDGRPKLKETHPLGDGRRLLSMSFSADSALLAVVVDGQPLKVAKLTEKTTEFRDLTSADLAAPASIACFAPSGQLLAAGYWDGKLVLWNAADSSIAAKCAGHDDRVMALAFHPDGKHLASGGEDRATIIWNAADGKRAIGPLLGGETVKRLAYSGDGTRLVACLDDYTVQLWNSQSGKHVGDPLYFENHAAAVFSPDSKLLAAGSWDGTIKLVDAQQGASVGPDLTVPDDIEDIAISPDGSTLAAACDDGKVYFWKLTRESFTSSELALDGHAYDIGALPSGKLLAIAAADGTIRVGAMDDPASLRIVGRHTGSVWRVALSPDGRYVASAADDGARLWDIARADAATPLMRQDGRIRALQFSDDGRTLLTAGDDGAVCLWEVNSRLEIAADAVDRADSTEAFIDPSGRLLAMVRSLHGNLVILDAKTGEEVRDQPPTSLLVDEGWFSPDGSCLLVTSNDGVVELWDTKDRPIRRRWTMAAQGAATNVTFDLAGGRVAYSDQSRYVQVRRLSDGQSLAELFTVETADSRSGVTMERLAFTEQDRLVGVASNGRLAQWQLGEHPHVLRTGDWSALEEHGNLFTRQFDADGRIRHSVRDEEESGDEPLTDAELLAASQAGGGAAQLTAANGLPESNAAAARYAFSPDGQWLAIARGNQIAICDSATGKPVQTLQPDRQTAWLSFSPDGFALLVGQVEGDCQVWNISDGSLRCTLRGGASQGGVFSADAAYIVTYHGNHVVLWEAQRGQPMVLPIHCTGDVSHAALSAEGAVLVTYSQTRHPQIWNLADLQNDPLERLSTDEIASLVRGLDGRKVSAGDNDLALITAGQRHRAAPGRLVPDIALASEASPAEWHEYYLQVCEAAGSYDAALWHLAELERLQAESDSPEQRGEFLCRRARILRWQGQTKQSLTAYERAIAVDPNNAEIRADRAMLYFGLQDWSAMADDLAQSLRMGRDDTLTNFLFSLACAQTGDFARVNDIVARLASPESDRYLPRLRLTRVRGYIRQQNFSRGIPDVLAVVRGNPSYPLVVSDLAIPADSQEQLLGVLSVESDPHAVLWLTTALIGLKTKQGDRLADALRPLLEHPQCAVRSAALDVLAKVPPPCDRVPMLTRALSDTDQGVLHGALRLALASADGSSGNSVQPLAGNLGTLLTQPRCSQLLPLVVELVEALEPDNRLTEPLLATLENDDEQVRAGVVRALGRLTDQAFRTVPPIIVATKDRHRSVRLAAATALGRLAAYDAAGIEALLALLDDADADVRVAAIQSLTGAGPQAAPALPKLIELAAVEHAPTRLAVAVALGRIVAGDQLTAPTLVPPLNDQNIYVGTLIDLLADESTEVSAAARESLTNFPPESLHLLAEFRRRLPELDEQSAVNMLRSLGSLIELWRSQDDDLGKLLREALGSPHANVRLESLQRIHDFISFDLKLVPDMIRLLESDPDRLVRVWCAFNIGKHPEEGKQAVALLKKTMHDDVDRLVRVEAAGAVWNIEGKNADIITVLRLAMVTGSDEVKEEALRIFSEHGSEALAALDLLPAALDMDDAQAQRWAAQALGNIGPQAVGAVEKLAALVAHPVEDTRVAVIEALGKIGSDKAVDALRKALADNSLNVRLTAAWSLAKCAPDSEPPLELLVGVLLDMQQTPEDRRYCAEILSIFGQGASGAVDALRKALADPAPPVREWAAYALGNIGPAAVAAVPEIAQLVLHDNQGAVRKWSIYALAHIHGDAEQSSSALAAVLEMRVGDDIRQQAAIAIGQFGAAATSAVGALEACIRNDASYPVRETAVEALGKISPARLLAFSQRALQDDSQAAIFHYAAGTAHAWNAAWQQAAEALRRVAELNDGEMRTYEARAWLVAERMDEYRETCQAMLTKLSAELAPDPVGEWVWVCSLSNDNGLSGDKLLDESLRAVEIDRYSPPAIDALTLLAYRLGKYQDAEIYAQHGLTLVRGGLDARASLARCHLLLAMIKYKLDKLSEAREHQSQAVAIISEMLPRLSEGTMVGGVVNWPLQFDLQLLMAECTRTLAGEPQREAPTEEAGSDAPEEKTAAEPATSNDSSTTGTRSTTSFTNRAIDPVAPPAEAAEAPAASEGQTEPARGATGEVASDGDTGNANGSAAPEESPLPPAPPPE